MALVRDYELPGTGLVVPNAYHVITKVEVEKRTNDIKPPVDNSREDNLTVRPAGTEVYWKAGYVGKIAITVWKDANARTADAKPIGYLGVNPSDNNYNASIGTPGMDHHCRFFIDVNSSDNEIVQAYKHLKTLDYYKDAVEV